jgi:hypothetical protein
MNNLLIWRIVIICVAKLRYKSTEAKLSLALPVRE